MYKMIVHVFEWMSGTKIYRYIRYGWTREHAHLIMRSMALS